MQHLKSGNYFGIHKKILNLENLTITNTEYTHERVDWHYHENVYFTYLIQGKLFEGNKKESYVLTPGTLIFHNWQDSHYNIRQSEYSQGFHIEMGKKWFDDYQILNMDFEGSIMLDNPLFQNIFYRLYFESKLDGLCSNLVFIELMLKIFGIMAQVRQIKESQIPAWVNKVKEILHDQYTDKLTLKYLAEETSIHPVHLSSAFPKYFHLTIGDYIRRLRIAKAVSLIQNKSLSLSEISFCCGFSDQSHFIRYFRKFHGFTPSQFRNTIQND